MRLNGRPPGQRAGGGARRKEAGRRAPAQPRRRLPWRRLVVAMLLAGSAGGLAWAWQSGAAAQAWQTTRDGFYRTAARSGLAVEQVLVEGRERSEQAALLAALGVERGMPILAFDPHAARARIEALAWVRSATVERRLPDTIHLSLVERRPMALWQLDGRVRVIDAEGLPIGGAEPGRFAALPLVVGEDAPEHVAMLLRMLAGEPELARWVVAAVRVGGRRWNLQLEGGIDVKLPETGADVAWARLARMVRDKKLLERDVVLVDLRLPDRLVVRTSRGEVPAPQTAPAAGRST